MKLSAPIFVLKQRAKVLSREEGIPLHQALDRIATGEGFSAWSLLAARIEPKKIVSTLLDQVSSGDLVLLGARPGQGKTRLSLELALQTMRHGGHAAFFTLDFTERDVADCFASLGTDPGEVRDRFLVDVSDKICADYVISRIASAPASMLVVIDYLQLLDQKRENPDLMHQVKQLKDFARERQLVILCLSQIDRSYDSANRSFPGISDVRLPNPLDLRLFDKLCFLHKNRLQIVPSA